MIIDIHTHAYPSAIAKRTMKSLSGVVGPDNLPLGNGTLEDLVARQKNRGIDISVVLNMAVKPHSVPRINNFALEINAMEGLLAFGAMHPDMRKAEMREELARLKAAGIKGIKLHPCYQGFHIDDKKAYLLYEQIADFDMTVLVHAGLDPMDMQHNYASPEASLQVHKDLPELKMILAHMGGAYQPAEAEKIIWGQEVYLDVALCGNDITGDQVKRLFDNHPNDKILYGSDYPWHDAEELWLLEYPGLTQQQKEKVLYKNAATLLGLQEAK